MSVEIVDMYPTRKNKEFLKIQRKDPVVYDNALDIHVISEDKIAFFEKNGYLLFQNLLSKQEIKSLEEELEILANDEETKKQDYVILEPNGGQVRSIFDVHKNNTLFRKLAQDKRVVDVIRQILGSDVYITQSRINRKPGFEGKEFYWHSDFETWHAEDGMPRMRAISCSINLTENFEFNGPLMVIPGSHKTYISCGGQTPEEHFKMSLKRQEIGTPDQKHLEEMALKNGIVSAKGQAGSAIFFDCNIMHGSSGNITPFPRSNVFFVYNSICNRLGIPFSAKKPRPNYIASRDAGMIISEKSLY